MQTNVMARKIVYEMCLEISTASLVRPAILMPTGIGACDKNFRWPIEIDLKTGCHFQKSGEYLLYHNEA